MSVNIEQVREALGNLVDGWKVVRNGLVVECEAPYEVADCCYLDDAHLIANAPEWLRQMADEIEALRAERDELRDAVSYYESMGGTFHDEMVSAKGGNDGNE